MPPVLTRTWYHTGVHQGREHISNLFADEYYHAPGLGPEELKALLLPDTVLPPGLTDDEAREACRALKGSMLRQEVYALDGKGTDDDYPFGHPYTVTEQNFSIQPVQPKADNRHGVFFTHPRESISYQYEREHEPPDPRTGHRLTLEVDRYGNVRKEAGIGYGRRYEDTDLTEQDDKDRQDRPLRTYTENDVTNAVDLPFEHKDYDPDNYRTPLPAETHTYELTGIAPANGERRFSFEEWAGGNGIIPLPDLADEIAYQETADHTTPQKRLIERVRTRYRRNDLTGLSDLGDLDFLALPGETYKLAFTPGLLDRVYRRRDGQPLMTPEELAAVLGGTGADEGG